MVLMLNLDWRRNEWYSDQIVAEVTVMKTHEF